MHKRLIARLDVKNGNVIKGIQLEGLRIIGTIVELAKRYYSQGFDELLILDAVASLYGRHATVDAIREAAREVFIPVTVGGGIRTMIDVKEVFQSGADRVAINSAALARPEFLREVANIYGAQAVVVSIEAKASKSGAWNCFYESGREDSGLDLVNWIASLDSNFVGEILITSVDQDGTRRGPDLDLIEVTAGLTDIPILYSGGISTHNQVSQILDKPHLAGVALGAGIHYGNLDVKKIKSSSKLESFSLPEVSR